MSKTISLHHIVFGTKNRMSAIDADKRKDLYRVIWAQLKENKCFLCRINGMPDHIHMLIDLNPSVALSDLMRNIKASTSQWMAKSEFFPLFEGWGKGYYAASLSYEHKTMVIDYIINQEKHHTSRSYLDEMKWLYDRNKLQWYDDDMA